MIQSAARMMLAAKRWKMLRNEILSAFARFQSQGEYTLTAKGACFELVLYTKSTGYSYSYSVLLMLLQMLQSVKQLFKVVQQKK